MVKACDYYGVSADYLLGRTLSRDGTTIGAEELYDLSEEKSKLHAGCAGPAVQKLLVNSIGALFDLLGKTGSREAIQAASNYLSTAVYQVYRRLYQANPRPTTPTFSPSPPAPQAGLAHADMELSRVELEDALAAQHAKDKGPMPEMDHAALARDYPVL